MRLCLEFYWMSVMISVHVHLILIYRDFISVFRVLYNYIFLFEETLANYYVTW